MKTFIISIAISFSLFFAKAQESTISEKGTTITITVPTTATTGEIIAGLYNEDTFMKAAPIKDATSKIENGKAVLSFTNVVSGTYGITLFHDTNGNKQMDFEANGMPKENYGVSNNVMNFGPPQWSDAKFDVDNEPITMEIRM
jgi:uncharacterized protein (DUF2141 family)